MAYCDGQDDEDEGAELDDPRHPLRHLRFLPVEHFAAGAARRRAQLGLPLLLAALRHFGPARRDERRLLRRGAVLARVAVARRGRQPGPIADHVRHRRRADIFVRHHLTRDHVGANVDRSRLPLSNALGYRAAVEQRRTTLAPASGNPSRNAASMPRAPPVTIATLSLSQLSMFPPVGRQCTNPVTPRQAPVMNGRPSLYAMRTRRKMRARPAQFYGTRT